MANKGNKKPRGVLFFKQVRVSKQQHRAPGDDSHCASAVGDYGLDPRQQRAAAAAAAAVGRWDGGSGGRATGTGDGGG